MAQEAAVAREGGVRALNAGNTERMPRKAMQAYREYLYYASDPDYREAYFDKATGGWMVTHRGHNSEHNAKDTARYFGTMTKEDLENECQREIVRMGGSVVFRDENVRGADGKTRTALDAVINGHLTDIRSVTENSRSYRNQLHDKNEQLRKWNRENPGEKARAITLYFHDPAMYSEKKLRDGITELKRAHIALRFKRVLVVVRGAEGVKEVRI